MSEYIHGLRSDSSSHKARAVGLARGNGEQAVASTSDGTSAVVSIAAVGALNKASRGGGNKRQDNSSLHIRDIRRVWLIGDGRDLSCDPLGWMMIGQHRNTERDKTKARRDESATQLLYSNRGQMEEDLSSGPKSN